ncbi:MAG: sugar phosphate isomerase/epimerase [Deltaproteobacteria bacterium]|nr:MAG: sugar phosphate isomerase/epimerase [Deltaproteobacteria bacterium]
MGHRFHFTIPYRMLRRRLKEVIEAGLSPEIYFDAQTLDDLDLKEVKEITEELSRHGLTHSLHGPYMDLAPGSPDPKIRGVSRERMEQMLEVAVHLDPVILVFHPGYDPWRYAEAEDLWLRESLGTWKAILRRASKDGLKIAIENVFERGPETIKGLLEGMDSPQVGFCFDTGHWLLFSRRGLDAWLGELGRWLFTLHIHDNHGEKDEHLPPGDGTFDFEALFSILPRRELLFTLEVHQEEKVLEGMRRMKKMVEDWDGEEVGSGEG